MTIRKVFDISEINLADIPARLRELADELERKPAPLAACLVVLDRGDHLDVRALGRECDRLRAVGMLFSAATQTSDVCYVDLVPDPAG